MVATKSGKQVGPDVDAKADGSQRKSAFKATVSPEHNKHRAEALQSLSAAATNDAKEAKLRALRAGDFQAYTFATPTGSPAKDAAGSRERPLTANFQSSGAYSPAGVAPMNLEESAFGKTFQEDAAEATEDTLTEVLRELKGLRQTVATKSDLTALKNELLQSTATLVEEKLRPLQTKLGNLEREHAELKQQVADLKAGKAGAGGGTQAPKRNDSSDPVYKRVAFVGFSSAAASAERVKAMQDYCSKYPTYQALVHFNKYKGPYNNRELTQVGFVEFADRDCRDNFLKLAKGQDCDVQGTKVKVKNAKTQFNAQRDYYLYGA